MNLSEPQDKYYTDIKYIILISFFLLCFLSIVSMPFPKLNKPPVTGSNKEHKLAVIYLVPQNPFPRCSWMCCAVLTLQGSILKFKHEKFMISHAASFLSLTATVSCQPQRPICNAWRTTAYKLRYSGPKLSREMSSGGKRRGDRKRSRKRLTERWNAG